MTIIKKLIILSIVCAKLLVQTILIILKQITSIQFKFNVGNTTCKALKRTKDISAARSIWYVTNCVDEHIERYHWVHLFKHMMVYLKVIVAIYCLLIQVVMAVVEIYHSIKIVLLIMNQTMTNYFLDCKYGAALFTVDSIKQTIN